jgi:hypothetical protein
MCKALIIRHPNEKASWLWKSLLPINV